MRKKFNELLSLKWYQKVIYIVICLLFVSLIFLNYSLVLVLYSLFALGCIIYYFFTTNRFNRLTQGNGIIYGNRGAGKGLLFQKKINSQKKAFCNIDYGKHVELFSPIEYINSIGDNTIIDAINGTIKTVKKLDKYEKINCFIDDTTLYFPNFADNTLKQLYPSLAITLAINRHLYDNSLIINVQNAERAYKILRELQTDFSVKALKTFGWGKLWNSIPILRNYVFVRYRYYEEVRSREEGVLPFKAIGAANALAKHLYLTGGQAEKEVFKAKYGRIEEHFIVLKKSKIYYDTRYFHNVFYGYNAPESD